MSDEQHLALPHLYGGPAYSRPPRPVEVLPRPFDPDELPLEAERSEEDVAWANQLTGAAWTSASAPATKARGGRGGRPAKAAKPPKAAKAGAASPAVDGSTPAAAPVAGSGGLEGRPFRLRGLGRIFRSDHK